MLESASGWRAEGTSSLTFSHHLTQARASMTYLLLTKHAISGGGLNLNWEVHATQEDAQAALDRLKAASQQYEEEYREAGTVSGPMLMSGIIIEVNEVQT